MTEYRSSPQIVHAGHRRVPRGSESPWFHAFPPAPDLSGEIVCTWSAVSRGHHLLVPDGCTDLLWLDDGTTVLCGPETRAWEFRLPPGVTAHGCRLMPGLAPSLLGLDAVAITNRRVPLEDIVGSRRARELGERVGEATDRRAEIETRVRHLIGTGPLHSSDDHGLVEALLTVSGPAPVDQVARRTGLRPRDLHRHAVAMFGYGPKTLLRLIRFQRFLHPPRPPGQRVPGAGHLAARAAYAGYYDQAHLARDCRRITGLTPSELLARHTPAFPARTDPYL
ncbi:MAG TPA: helix-turn-helix domain-containing protein [Acidimicrobiales bacterium]|nr:helix-turn-helix domain-containing protein [Acidimicrobiales bacterium]